MSLYPVIKEVIRTDTGKPHRQRYWLSSKDVQAGLEHAATQSGQGDRFRAYMKLVDQAGGNPDVAADMIRSWGSFDGPFRKHALEFLGASCTRENLDRVANETADRFASFIERNKLMLTEAERFPKTRDEAYRAILRGNEDPVMRRTVQAMNTIAMEWHGGPGRIVEALRGVTGEQATEIIARLANGDSASVRSNGLTSFSTNPEIANRFAGNSAYAASFAGGVVFRQNVPTDSIVAASNVPGSPFTVGGESEVVVASNGAHEIREEDVENAWVIVYAREYNQNAMWRGAEYSELQSWPDDEHRFRFMYRIRRPVFARPGESTESVDRRVQAVREATQNLPGPYDRQRPFPDTERSPARLYARENHIEDNGQDEFGSIRGVGGGRFVVRVRPNTSAVDKGTAR